MRPFGERYVAWIGRRRAAVIAASAIAFALGALGASRLSLRASLRELLPRGDRAAAAVDEATRRVGEFSSLVVAVSSPDRATSRAFAARLAHRIEALGPDVVERAICRAPEVRAFFDRNRFLYADEAWLGDLLARVRFERRKRENPLLVSLDEPPAWDELRRRAETTHPVLADLGTALAGPQDEGDGGAWLEGEDGRLVAIVVLPGARHEAGVSDEALEHAVRGAIAAEGPLPPGLSVSLSGEVHTSVIERRAIQKDVAVTTCAVVLLVGLAVGLAFGRPRAIPLMAAPALLGAILALGAAGVAFGALNATTAFLGGIIVGNGINFPILVLARYDEERDRGRDVDGAIARAVIGSARPTALAAFAAAVAYGSLALTRFRGFSQFGVIGALGMALCWAASMTLLPALLFSLDGNGRRARHRKARRVPFGGAFARLAERAPRAVLAVGATLTIASALVLPGWLRDPYEYDFRRLRSVVVDDTASKRLDGIFGRALGPQIVLAGSRAEARLARRAILDRAAAEPQNPVAHVVTLDDLLPGPPDAQARKLALLAALRDELRDDRLTLLTPAQRERALKWRPPGDLRPLDVADLPDLLRRPFRERDGTLGRVVLVYPPTRGFSTWNGHDLFRLARVLADVPIPGGRVLSGAGRATTWASMIAAIAHDGAIATIVSLVGVFALTLALLKGRPIALWVIGALCLGVLWMLGAAAAASERLNFLNFVALPITFGIGVDYAANVVSRYRAEGRGTMPRVLRSTGGAVFLNSLTTIIGYAALLLAHNRALRSFGALAILGELACLLAALAVLPAIAVLRDRRAEEPAVRPMPAG